MSKRIFYIMKYIVVFSLATCSLIALEPDSLEYKNFYNYDHQFIFYDDDLDGFYERIESFTNQKLEHSNKIKYSSDYTRFAFHELLKDSNYIVFGSRDYCRTQKFPEYGRYFIFSLNSSIFSVSIMTSCGSDTRDATITSEISSVKSKEYSDNLSVNPNPIVNSFNINFPKELEIVNIQNIKIFDIVGNEITKLQSPSGHNSTIEFDVSGLINGVYYLIIEYENISISRKIIIIH